MTSEREFVKFVEDAFPRLRRTAFLLCGDWHTAEDLAQTALAKMFVSWGKIEQRDAADAYARRTLVNSYRTHMRLKRTGELLTGRLPEPSVQAPAPEERMLVLDALAALPPRSRTVVVLRYWEDLSVEQVADMLGCSTGNVKSLSARALKKLQSLLGEALGDVARPALWQEKAARQGTSAMVETTQRRPQDSALIHEPRRGQHESGGTCDG